MLYTSCYLTRTSRLFYIYIYRKTQGTPMETDAYFLPKLYDILIQHEIGLVVCRQFCGCHGNTTKINLLQRVYGAVEQGGTIISRWSLTVAAAKRSANKFDIFLIECKILDCGTHGDTNCTFLNEREGRKICFFIRHIIVAYNGESRNVHWRLKQTE